MLSIIHLIIDTIFGSFITILLLRLLLEWFKADLNNPLGEMLMKVSNPVLTPVRKFVPAIGGIDWATIAVILVASFAEQFLLFITGGGHGISGVVLHTFGGVLRLTYYIYFFATVLSLIGKYLPADRIAPIMSMLNKLIDLPLSLLRRYIQPMYGIDLASIVFLVLLLIANVVVVHPLMS